MERLVLPEEYKEVYKKGTLRFGRYVAVTMLPVDEEIVRVGFSVSKKVGNAVVRNLVKRRLKEIVRVVANDLRPGNHIVIGAKRSSRDATFPQLRSDLLRAMQGLGCFDRNIGGEGH